MVSNPSSDFGVPVPKYAAFIPSECRPVLMQKEWSWVVAVSKNVLLLLLLYPVINVENNVSKKTKQAEFDGDFAY